ncbi:hypothetical protein HPP92_008972 [Vanilla planifolia]|uniref:Gem-associated protein 2 n=1 Tax=Vanilla planifolia TaxID=51239 RepID=A0A835V665_VANPL|nr:hypothetical protein HPP92_008972 [Vanilla planifolia]
MDVDGQKRRWKELYSGLEGKVAREYDGLRIPNEQNKKKPGYLERPNSLARNGFETVDVVFSLNEEKDSCIFTISRASNEEALMCCQNWMGNESYSESGDIDEQEYEDDDSDDEYDSIQRLAFLVDGEPDFDSGPPLDGLEYLRRVRWEAKQIPKVKVAQLNLSTAKGEQTPYMPNIPKIEECPQNLLPSKVWEESFLADFSKIRQEFSELEASGIRPNEFTVEQKPKGDPTVTALLSMDANSRASILRRSIDLFEASSALSRADCLWLYALCATVDSPVNANTCASLRGLLRKCSSLMATKSELDDEVAMLNILIVIAGKYFGQSENR